MARIGTRAEVWFSNVVASFARYVVERTLPESVPMLMRRDAVTDSFYYAKENMQDAYSFLDRFDGLRLSIEEAKRRFPARKLVLEFGVYKAGMINYQARKFPELNFVGFDSFEGLQEQWSGMAPQRTFDLGGRLPRVLRPASRYWCTLTATPTPQRSTCWKSVLTTSNMVSLFILTITSGFPIGETPGSRR